MIPSIKGNIRSAFKDSEESFVLSVTVPVGTVATVVLPCSDYTNVTVNGKPYNGNWKFEAGDYEFKCIK
jgi:hypothetical protein